MNKKFSFALCVGFINTGFTMDVPSQNPAPSAPPMRESTACIKETEPLYTNPSGLPPEYLPPSQSPYLAPPAIVADSNTAKRLSRERAKEEARHRKEAEAEARLKAKHDAEVAKVLEKAEKKKHEAAELEAHNKAMKEAKDAEHRADLELKEAKRRAKQEAKEAKAREAALEHQPRSATYRSWQMNQKAATSHSPQAQTHTGHTHHGREPFHLGRGVYNKQAAHPNSSEPTFVNDVFPALGGFEL